MSGFTTTGASIFRDIDFPESVDFWRSFTHWIGGMGVLVFFGGSAAAFGEKQPFSDESRKPGTCRYKAGSEGQINSKRYFTEYMYC